MGKKGVEEIIDEIEIFINNCKYQPLSQNKIVVHKEELEQLLNELKLKLPSEIERCKKIMKTKEHILADARTRSDAIINESVSEANRLVDQHQITELANIRANEILEMARNQAQQIVDQASEEATEIRMGAMYYTKDKLSEMHDLCNKITEMEKANYKTLIDTMEQHTYTISTNLEEMETNINLLSASSGMSYTDDDQDLDSAFSNKVDTQTSASASDLFDEPDEEEAFNEEDDFLDEDDDFLED